MFHVTTCAFIRPYDYRYDLLLLGSLIVSCCTWIVFLELLMRTNGVISDSVDMWKKIPIFHVRYVHVCVYRFSRCNRPKTTTSELVDGTVPLFGLFVYILGEWMHDRNAVMIRYDIQ